MRKSKEKQTTIGKFNRNKKQKDFDWHNYNLSQTREKALFVNILGDLCSLVQEPKRKGGRKPTKTRDIIFAMVMKEYLTSSSRRLQSDLKLFQEAQFIGSMIPFNTLLDHMERIDIRDILKQLIEISSLPLREIETDFAIDASGFSVSRYVTYFDYRHKKDRRAKIWRKCHAVCGVKTNIIVSIELTDGNVHDQKMFSPLAKDTARNFKIEDFCADKGYLSSLNFELIKLLGGQAYIPFKKNTSGRSSDRSRSYFRSAFRHFKKHKDEYFDHYHKRSNIESCFSMVKRRFGNNVRCKKESSQDNEILCKFLALNICILIQELFLSKISLDFISHCKTYVARN